MPKPSKNWGYKIEFLREFRWQNSRIFQGPFLGNQWLSVSLALTLSFHLGFWRWSWLCLHRHGFPTLIRRGRGPTLGTQFLKPITELAFGDVEEGSPSQCPCSSHFRFGKSESPLWGVGPPLLKSPHHTTMLLLTAVLPREGFYREHLTYLVAARAAQASCRVRDAADVG